MYWKVMGRWFFQIWAMMLLPCSIIANFGDEWVWISAVVMLILPTVIWFWMFYWTNIGTMFLDKSTYAAYRQVHRDPWTTDNDLNWDDLSSQV